MDKILIKRALISTTDKEGLDELCQALESFGVEIISTGGTKRHLDQKGVFNHDITYLTNFPEMLDGRVKTLHTAVHGGLLAVRDNPNHIATCTSQSIRLIDLLVVNLYQFSQAVAHQLPLEDTIENIDIGGPAMVRSASKNHKFVAVLTNPAQYKDFINHIRENHGCTQYPYRQQLAGAAFAMTAEYDGAISQYFAGLQGQTPLPPIQYGHAHQLRYGENPQQNARFIATGTKAEGLAGARILQGKEMSYNNYADASSAIQCAQEFDEPAAVIIKHADPCGVAIGGNAQIAFERAMACDSVSAFGGIVAINRNIDEDCAKMIAQSFFEVIIAPSFDNNAQKIFAKKPNLRVMIYDFNQKISVKQNIKSVLGGILVQDNDDSVIKLKDCRVPTKIKPSASEWHNLLFAWKVAKFARSNAVVIAADDMGIGIGSGAVSRILACEIAIAKSRKFQQLQSNLVAASDAFFPFADSIQALVQYGVKAIIQPGGSIKDDEVIKAADDHGISMIFTNIRHFRH